MKKMFKDINVGDFAAIVFDYMPSADEAPVRMETYAAVSDVSEGSLTLYCVGSGTRESCRVVIDLRSLDGGDPYRKILSVAKATREDAVRQLKEYWSHIIATQQKILAEKFGLTYQVTYREAPFMILGLYCQIIEFVEYVDGESVGRTLEDLTEEEMQKLNEGLTAIWGSKKVDS